MIGGGVAPIAATKLIEISGSSAIGWMLAIYGVLSLACCAYMPETNDRNIESSDVGSPANSREPAFD